MPGKMGAVSRLHAFPRAQEHLVQQTRSGAVVTLLGVLTMLLLFVHELRFYMEPYREHKMGVDGSAGSSMLHILLNITFPALPCQVLSLDALDMSGKHEVDLHTTIFKERVDRHGLRLGKELIRDLVEGELNPEGWRSLSSAQNEASAQAIRQALEEGEGCNLHGHLVVQRVAGNFHFSVHGHPYATLQRVFAHLNEVNVSHVIHGVGFGQTYPGLINPLDGFVRMLDPERGAAGGTFKYFLKVVPTEFHFLKGRGISTNQYSVTEYFTPSSPADTALPAVFFLYDLSPITVSIEEKHRNLFHFLTRLCAVLGGTFALTGMLDRWVYELLKQARAGKQRL